MRYIGNKWYRVLVHHRIPVMTFDEPTQEEQYDWFYRMLSTGKFEREPRWYDDHCQGGRLTWNPKDRGKLWYAAENA